MATNASMLGFSWPGTSVAFFGFGSFIGVEMAKETYKALVEDPGPSNRAVGVGHALNLIIQWSVVTLGGGLAAGSEKVIRGACKAPGKLFLCQSLTKNSTPRRQQGDRT